MKNQLKLIFALFTLCALIFAGCTSDDCEDITCFNDGVCDNGTCDCPEGWTGSDCSSEASTETETLDLEITSDLTLTNDKIWLMEGKVVVDNGATLTIEPGTIIKAAEGTDVNASALIVARGAKIDAVGTASEPIIFTSVLDDIDSGETASTLDRYDWEKWGGIVILGYAKTSCADGNTECQIEGIPDTESYGKYGGDDDADNSGTMSYVSIRFGGATIGEGNELNGLTLGGVGSGTSISNIEIANTLDDGIEFFGGSVDVTNIVIAFQGDDGVDLDMNYSGTIDNFVVLQGNEETDEALEFDGPESTTNTAGVFSAINGTCISVDGEGSMADLKSGAQGTISGVHFQGYSSGIKVRTSFDYDATTLVCTEESDAYTNIVNDGNLVIMNSYFEGAISLSDAVNAYTGDAECEALIDSAYELALDNNIASGNNTISSGGGADTSVFGWTWAAQNGYL